MEDALRLMTYNVHSCIGMDGKLDPERIARVIARSQPGVVALQGLDVARERTGNRDQAEMIADYLRMEFHVHPALHLKEERYGDAILTHLPMRLVKADALPGLEKKSQLEPRGTLSSRVPGLRVDHVFVTPDIEVQGVEVPGSELARMASDRLPLVVTLRSIWGRH